mmetsp:Transcript_77671/g.116806  ORF Transcript_77671/g.116806 Transcript_77671/m.116806 type:complete len:345 (+) Transcript_77671:46-1080(+)
MMIQLPTMQIRQPVSQSSSFKKKKPTTKTTTTTINKRLPWLAIVPIVLTLCILMFSCLLRKNEKPPAGGAGSVTANGGDKEVMIREAPPTPTSSALSVYHDGNDKPKITYASVSTGDPDVLRYAAYYSTSGSGETTQEQPLSVAKWAAAMAHEDETYATELAANLTKIIKDSGFPAIRFETKGASSCTSNDKHFEFVLVQDTFLSRFAGTGDPSSFQEHFDTCQSSQSPSSSSSPPPCCVFDNLSGSATLVAPMPGTDLTAYGHVAAFCNKAPAAQVHQTWRRVGQEFVQQLKASTTTKKQKRTVWFSTAGTGVAWLHFRFDDRPKYYHYRPFAEAQRDDGVCV